MTDPTHAAPAAPDPLRQKYRQERDKRINPAGETQYIAARGAFAHLDRDHFVTEPLVREPIVEDLDVLVIGAGFGGMLTGANLRGRGVESFRIVDVAADFGGTWYWNRYPGVRCDIESYLYMPRLEEVGTIPTERYATGKEIFAHSQRFARHYDLYDRALLQTRVTRVAWHEGSRRWHVTTDRGDLLRARFVTLSQGPLAKVKLPGIPGLLEFQGPVFHASRWDYGYTGGDSEGGLDGLAGQRIGIIGTGATGVQIVPVLAKHAGHVTVFQRTPPPVAARNNRPTDTDWFRSLPAGWQAERSDNFVATIGMKPNGGDQVADCWTDFFVRVGKAMARAQQSGQPVHPPSVVQPIHYAKMGEIRDHVGSVIKDPATAELAKPWYDYLCKRPLFSDDYLHAFNLPNVSLVDTSGRGIERVTPTGVVVDGQEHPLDAIVLATGFDVGAAPHKVGDYELIGRDGLTLDAKWAGGVRTVHGTQMAGFPNLHIVGGTAQGIMFFNFTVVLEIQARHAVDQIARCLAVGTTVCEVTEAAEARWAETMREHHHDMSHFHEECTPSFLNNEGRVKDKPTFIGATFGGGPLEYRRLTAAWRREGYLVDTRRRNGSAEAVSLATR